MVITVFFQILGGLAFFLYGMKIMSEGLQNVAGRRMRKLLNAVSNNRFVGFGTGAIITSIIQSSSASTVMTVGFVESGLMNLTQAVGVVIGVNVGTTMTAQIIAFQITKYAMPAIAVGVFMKFFAGSRKWINIGDAFLGFGLVFYGLTVMSNGFVPLKDNPAFISFFTLFTADTISGVCLCVLSGCVLTMIVQSSSATVGIAITLAFQGILDFPTSVALVLGDNIGTTVTAQLASIGMSSNAKKVANAHTLFNLIGTLLILSIFPYFISFVEFFTASIMNIGNPEVLIEGVKPNIARYIANAHTMFNVVCAIFFLILLPQLVKLSELVTFQKDNAKIIDEIRHIKFIDNKYINTPEVALNMGRSEIIRMSNAVCDMYNDVLDGVRNRRLKELSKWRKSEDAIDSLQREMVQYFVGVLQHSTDPNHTVEANSLILITNNLERIADALENIAKQGEYLVEQNLNLSEGAINDFEIISLSVKNFIDFVVNSISADNKKNSNILTTAEKMENEIDALRNEMRSNHLARLKDASCTVDQGIIFVDMLSLFEKMGDYCFNIAQSLSGKK